MANDDADAGQEITTSPGNDERRSRWKPLDNRTNAVLAAVAFVGSVAGVASLATSQLSKVLNGWYVVLIFALSISGLVILFWKVTGRYIAYIQEQQNTFVAAIQQAQAQHNTGIENLTNQIRDLERSVEHSQRLDSAITAIAELSNQVRLQSALEIQQPVALALSLLRDKISNLAREYSRLVGKECSVCVKEIYLAADKNQNYHSAAKTLCRSQGHPERFNNIVHWISENTAFREIVIDGNSSWFCSDVDSYPDYNNTSPNHKYRSVIIWPLEVSIRFADAAKAALPPPNIVGFLCLDSNVPEAFSRSHLAIGWQFANSVAQFYEAVYMNQKVVAPKA